FFLLKDISTIAFALTMGLAGGWPLLLLSGVSGLTKLAAMRHFRWARLSPAARQRRESTLAPATANQTSQDAPAFPAPTAYRCLLVRSSEMRLEPKRLTARS